MHHLKKPKQKSEKKRSLAAVIRGALLTAFVLFLASQTGTHAAGKAGQDFPPRPGSTPIVIVATGRVPTNHVGVLTTTQRQMAVRDALHEYFVKKLLRGHSYTIKGSSAWTTASGNMGGLVKFRFPRPANLSGLWLKRNRVLFRASYSNVVALHVYVDLRQNLVMKIVPKRRA